MVTEVAAREEVGPVVARDFGDEALGAAEPSQLEQRRCCAAALRCRPSSVSDGQPVLPVPMRDSRRWFSTLNVCDTCRYSYTASFLWLLITPNSISTQSVVMNGPGLPFLSSALEFFSYVYMRAFRVVINRV